MAASKTAKSLKVDDTLIKSSPRLRSSAIVVDKCPTMPMTAISEIWTHHCGKHWHIAAACRVTGQGKDTNYVAEGQNEDSLPRVLAGGEDELHLYAVKKVGTHPIQVSMMLNRIAHILELDTGTAFTIMSQGEYRQLFPGVPLKKSSTLLRTYSGKPLSVLGVMNVDVQYKQQRESLKLTIVS